MRKTKETQAQRIAVLEKMIAVLYNRQKGILEHLNKMDDETIIE